MMAPFPRSQKSIRGHIRQLRMGLFGSQKGRPRFARFSPQQRVTPSAHVFRSWLSSSVSEDDVLAPTRLMHPSKAPRAQKLYEEATKAVEQQKREDGGYSGDEMDLDG
ncbi:hypothetical protein BCR44DRAFT_1018412 [Catenaria anguillulae PL171]|uniref:Uncharacterized protein n=1 Tax=Catenaria anguillulae PL171 TaxID=765915 RepID=A0A1Y2H7Z0_9FUNG|nr:hypothetical protein BCR44DRAFT_1018412 [Catenaria anguillulae PL171]